MAALGYVHDGKPEPYRQWQRMGADGELGVIGTASVMIRPYTTSIDAVTALLERVLPGWKWSVGHFGAQCRGNVWFDPDQIEFASFADEPERALLAAVLRAVEGARR